MNSGALPPDCYAGELGKTAEEISNVARLTITEALADIKTINARLATHWDFVSNRLARPAQVKDPLEKDGTTTDAAVRQHRQAARDLRTRIVKLRSAIAQVNQAELLTIDGLTRSIADWIVWRREVAPGAKNELNQLSKSIDQLRAQARSKGGNLKDQSNEPADIILHISETELVQEREHLEKVLGTLDGLLSLKNATTFVEVAD